MSRQRVVCLLVLVPLSGHGRAPTLLLSHESYERESRGALMSAESSQGDSEANAAAALSGIMQRLVAANLFPAEYAGSPSVAGGGVPLRGLPFDVDARFFSAGGTNFVCLHDSFSKKDHWYTQGAIEAADVGEKIGRTWGTARWPTPIPPPANLSGDRHISAAGEAIPLPDHVKDLAFRLFRAPNGAGYVRMTDTGGRPVWFSAASIGA